MLALEAGAERQRALPGADGPHRAMHPQAGLVATRSCRSTGGRSDHHRRLRSWGWRWAAAVRRAVAALVNGGLKVTPTLWTLGDGGERPRLVSATPVPDSGEIMRLNVTNSQGTAGTRRLTAIASAARQATARCRARAAIARIGDLLFRRARSPWTHPRSCAGAAVRAAQRRGSRRPHHAASRGPATARIVERIAPLLASCAARELRLPRPARLTPRPRQQ